VAGVVAIGAYLRIPGFKNVTHIIIELYVLHNDL